MVTCLETSPDTSNISYPAVIVTLSFSLPFQEVMTSPGAMQGGGDAAGQVSPLVLSLDVGTTTIRAHVYDAQIRVCGSSQRKVC